MTTCLWPKYWSARSNSCVTDNEVVCISPCMAAHGTVRPVPDRYRPELDDMALDERIDEAIDIPTERPWWGPIALVAFVVLVICSNVANVVWSTSINDSPERCSPSRRGTGTWRSPSPPTSAPCRSGDRHAAPDRRLRRVPPDRQGLPPRGVPLVHPLPRSEPRVRPHVRARLPGGAMGDRAVLRGLQHRRRHQRCARHPTAPAGSDAGGGHRRPVGAVLVARPHLRGLPRRHARRGRRATSGGCSARPILLVVLVNLRHIRGGRG